MESLIILIDTLKQTWRRTRQQRRLALIQGELETAQADCAALGAYICRLIQKKTELETQIQRTKY